MDEIRPRNAQVTFADIERVGTLIETRLDRTEDEDMRTILARRFLSAALTLDQVLRAHTRCALINHCGSVGQSRLDEKTGVLFEAFDAYATTIMEVAAAARKLIPSANRDSIDGATVLRVI